MVAALAAMEPFRKAFPAVAAKSWKNVIQDLRYPQYQADEFMGFFGGFLTKV